MIHGRRNRDQSVWLACLLTLGVTLGCQPSPSETQATSKAGDPAQVEQRLAEVQAALAQGDADQRGVKRLTALRNEYPEHRATYNLLVSELVKREDWSQLTQLLRNTPASLRSDSHELDLATILLKERQYAEAFELMNPQVDERGEAASERVAWMAGFAAFHVGELERAATILDANRDRFLAAGHKDLHLLRGMAHFQLGELTEAERELGLATEAMPNQFKPHDVLGRVLAAAGKPEESRRHLDRAEQLRTEAEAARNKQLRLAAVAKALDKAFADKDFDKCEEYIAELMPEVNPASQSKLYEYIAAIRAAQGRPAEAQAAVDNARALRPQGAASPTGVPQPAP